MKRLGFLVLGLTFVAFHCTPPKPEHFTQDQPLYEHAMKLYTDESFEESITFFESLRNRFPQSPLTIDAELKIADAHFEKADYLEAEAGYQSFRSLHPTHAKVPYAMYREGFSNFKQIPKGQGRDQAYTEKALSVFQELTRVWPLTPEARDAETLISKCKRNLALRDLYVGRFYVKQKKYEAALVRLEPLASNSEFDDIRKKAEKYRATARKHLPTKP